MDYLLKNRPRNVDTKVIIGTQALENLPELIDGYTKAVLITDESCKDHCLEKLKDVLPADIQTIVLTGGEASKDLKAVEAILIRLRESGFDRKSLVIALGGGVINDVGGFTASIYMRGIDWIMLPTTLTAQADASIGGKTGVNLAKFKNMAGSFWPANAVLIDPGFLSTLPVDHLKNGLAEIIKMGFIYDRQILKHVEKISPDNLLGEELNRASELSAKAKIEIVSSDTYEAGERKLLNFGHSVGHALEAISLETESPLLHGEAVAIGMVAEAKLAESEGVAQPGLSDSIIKTLKKFDLPTSYKQVPLEEIMKRIAADKKNVGKQIHWTLPKETGKGIYDHVAEQDNIEQAIKSVIS